MSIQWTVDSFGPRAQLAVKLAKQAAVAAGAEQMDSRHLLLGLAQDTAAWPAGSVIPRALLNAQQGPGSIERPGRLRFEGLPVSQEVGAIIENAEDLAGGGTIETDHLLMAMSDGTGSEASSWMRQITSQADPWQGLRQHFQMAILRLQHPPEPARGGREEHGVGYPPPEASTTPLQAFDRVQALIFLLMREKVSFGTMSDIVSKVAAIESVTYKGAEAEAELARKYTKRLWAGPKESKEGEGEF